MAKYKKKSPAPQITNSVSFDCPAISVIIPMYNVEKYVGECLDSLLAQTFTDFEAIVVDDCSTDKSVKIAESYAPKFGGRLKLLHMEYNTGSGAFPRNKGVETARGKYVSFIDADDALTPTAFEELYSVAKDFDADVVACEKFYIVPEERWHDTKFRKQLKPIIWRDGDFVTKPTLLTEDISDRAKRFHQREFVHNVWSQLFRRELILKNNLTMPNIPAEDMVFTICALCIAKRYVVVPNVVNYYRIRENSITTEKISNDKFFHKWLQALRIGFKYIDEFLSMADVETKFLFLDTFAQEIFGYFVNIYAQVPAPTLDEFLREEFSDGDDLALNVFIFNAMNIYRLQLIDIQQQLDKFNRLSEQIQQRLDELEEINRKDKAYISELEKFIANEIR